MKVAFAALAVLVALAACVHAAVAAPTPSSPPAPGPVVVELFSSEGCSSCPPADAMLRSLAERLDVIALEFHIDYWGYIGWADPFAAPEHGERQAVYARALARGSVVTPQVVVGGQAASAGCSRAASSRPRTRWCRR